MEQRGLVVALLATDTLVSSSKEPPSPDHQSTSPSAAEDNDEGYRPFFVRQGVFAKKSLYNHD
jgi:hypothetical protein